MQERIGSAVGEKMQNFCIVDVPLVATPIQAALPASFAATGFLLQAYTGNAGNVFIGGPNVTGDAPLAATTGAVLAAGVTLSIDAMHVSETYMVATVINQALIAVSL